MAWSKIVVDEIKRRGFWADAMDPASGFPLFGERGACPYPDVAGARAILKYNTLTVGPCQMLSHPLWGTWVYPSTLFIEAPDEVVESVLSSTVIVFSQLTENEGL